MSTGASLASRCTQDQIVVSVGPYMFHTDPERSTRRSASSRGTASPPMSTFSSPSPAQPASSSSRNVVGVACSTVMRPASIRAASARPSTAVSRLAISTCAPVVSGNHSSRPAMSNERLVTASTQSDASRPGSRAIEARKFTTARCGMATPFGLPVDPEV
ncbi:MAG: hypothetical protein QM820_02450 [Minicystis sp.]